LLGRDFRPNLKLGARTLKTIARMRFLRRLCGAWWHREERDFLAWYEDLLGRFTYRDVRIPKMEAAKSRAGELLTGRQPAADPTLLQIGDPEPIPP